MLSGGFAKEAKRASLLHTLSAPLAAVPPRLLALLVLQVRARRARALARRHDCVRVRCHCGHSRVTHQHVPRHELRQSAL
jgi:hypothetical protein